MIDLFDILAVIIAVVCLFFGVYGGVASVLYSVMVIVIKKSAYKKKKPSCPTVNSYLAKLKGLFKK